MTKKVGRNDLCPCGSLDKYKCCCWLDQPRIKRHTAWMANYDGRRPLIGYIRERRTRQKKSEAVADEAS